MKTLKVTSLVATSLAIFALSASAADQTLCPSTANYAVSSANPTSTFTWEVVGGTSGTDYNLTIKTPTSSSSIEWVTPGNYSIKTQETNEFNCKGPIKTITVKVSKFASPDNITETACSYTDGVETGAIGVTLPTEDAEGNAIDKWVVTAVALPSGVTAHSSSVGELPFEITNKSLLASDSYVNTNNTPKDVVFNITPYTGDCPGTPFTATVTVYPVVLLPTITF